MQILQKMTHLSQDYVIIEQFDLKIEKSLVFSLDSDIGNQNMHIFFT